MQHKLVDHQVSVQEDTTQKYFPMNESLLLLMYLVKTISSIWQAAKSINYEIIKEIFSFWHLFTLNSLFT